MGLNKMETLLMSGAVTSCGKADCGEAVQV